MFGPPPKQLHTMEGHALHKLLHLAGNAFTVATMVHWSNKGGPPVRSVVAMAWASGCRMAVVHRQLHSYGLN